MRLTLLPFILMAASSLCVSAFAEPTTQPEVKELRIDFSKRQEPFVGWGTSLCWWAHGVGGWSEEEVDKVVKLITDPAEGLGMNIFRYNIGGGDAPGHSHFRRWGDVPGFKASADAPYDWSADANQRGILLKLKQACPDALFEAFSNSPPWWMTHSGCTAGSEDGGENLKPEFEERFVEYLVDVSKHYQDQFHIKWYTVEPFNEPDVNWWRKGKDQEGCHVSREQQARVIRLLRARLDSADMKSTLVAATDSNSIDDTLKSLQSFDAPTFDALGQVNTHSYAGDKRQALRDLARQHAKPLWQSETGPLWVGGSRYEQMMKIAERITLDINQLQPRAWLTWQVVAGGEWGEIHEHFDTKSTTLSKRFYILSSFTRNIRPGDQFVEVSGKVSAVAAISDSRREAVIVLVNRDKTPQPVRAVLGGLRQLPVQASAFQTSGTQDLQAVAPATVSDSALEITLPAESVTQLVLKGAE